MSRKSRKIKNKVHGHVKDMLICPVCRAMSYPRKITNPKTEDEAKALFCASCLEDVTPYIEAYQEFLKKQKEIKEKAVVDSSNVNIEEVKNDESIS